MDISLRGISCDDSLPVSIVEETFALTCGGEEECALSGNAIAAVSGQFVLSSFQYYDDNGGTEILIAGMLETQSKDIVIRKTLELCNIVTGNSGNACPYDGTFDFNTTVALPAGSWIDSGFGATADVELVAHDGTRIGSCLVKFATPVHGIGVSSMLVFVSAITVAGIVIFITVFMVFAKQVFTAQRLRRMRMNAVHPDDDDSMVTQHTSKTGGSKYTDDKHEDDNDSDTYDDTTRTSLSNAPGSWSYKTNGTWSYKTNGTWSYRTYDTAYTNDTSFYTYTTETGKEGGVGGAFAKAWRIGGLVIERIVNGKPLRTPPRAPPSPPIQEQVNAQTMKQLENQSETSVAASQKYVIMKDEEVVPSIASSKPSKPDEHVDANAYSQMEDGSIELKTTSSSYSSVDLSCDSMDVQANDRTSRYACGATSAVTSDGGTTTDAMAGVRAVGNAMHAMGVGFMGKAVPDTGWFTSNKTTDVTKPAPETEEEEVREDYHDMKVYTVGNDNENVQYYGRVTMSEGNHPVSYWSSTSDDDSSRDNATPDDSSIVPAVPRDRQQMRFNASPEHQAWSQVKNTLPPTRQNGYIRSDSSSVNPVFHGSRVDGQQPSGKGSNGAFVRWEGQSQWKRSEKWTAASINRFGEL